MSGVSKDVVCLLNTLTMPSMEKRKEVVRLLLTEGEAKRIQAAAAERGLPVATWVRMIALKFLNEQ